MKKGLVVVLALLLSLGLVAGCNGGGGGGGTDLSVEDIFDAIKEQIAADLVENGMGDDAFEHEELPGYSIVDLKGEDGEYVLTEIDKADIEEGFVIEAGFLNADKIVILRAVDGKVNDIKAIFEAEKEAQIEMWQDYAPDQAQKVRDAVLEVQGNVLIYVVYSNADALAEIFNGVN